MTARFPPAPLLAFTGVLGVGLLIGLLAGKGCSGPALPVIPPLSSSVIVLRPTANVLLAVQDLARLESASFHMERVIDLKDKQSRLFGLIEAEDAILLVAVADVAAGVDLQKLTRDDVQADSAKKSVKITLPPPQVFYGTLNNLQTYVHTRSTGALATRRENLETRARQEAERRLVEAALQAGLLGRASDNAKRAVEALVRALGYEQVQIAVTTSPEELAVPARSNANGASEGNAAGSAEPASGSEKP